MRWFAEWAWLPTGLAAGVVLEERDGVFSAVTTGADPAGTERLPGLVLPGFANAHSHAFHRALRGRTHEGRGSFWTWRERMYALAARLDPDTYATLATAAYAEMALAGVTTVAEFHYLHHGPDGRPYADQNAMGAALTAAAAAAGVRLTLLDTCYLAGGLEPTGPVAPQGVQRRFADVDADAWAARQAAVQPTAGMRPGVAAHSARAVPAAALPRVVEAGGDRPRHVHLSEQPAENAAVLAATGRTPTRLLADAGFWAPAATAVHATHLAPADIAILGAAGVSACFCPTTERDLADGIGPARALADAGVRLSLGSDQQATTDLLAEAQALEADERLASLERGRFTAAGLLTALTAHDSLGWPDAGRLEAGARADLVAVRLDTVRTAGAAPAQAILTAGAADVDTVVADGRTVVQGGRHVLGDVGRLLAEAIEPLWADA